MDDKQSASSWDDLIKEIGAAPASDALERKRPAIETPLAASEAAPPPSVPRPASSDWNALAAELGLEPTEVAADPPRSSREQRAPQPPTEARRSTPDMEAGFASIAPIESAFEQFEEEFSDLEGDVEFEDRDGDSELVAEDDGDGDDGEEPPGLSGEAARSAFEALFQAGSFAAGPQEKSSRGREASPRREEADRRRDPAPTERGRRDDRPPRGPREEHARSDGRDRPSLREDETGEPGEEGGESSDRPRRRRRRGRGRGRGRGAREEESTATEAGRDATPRPADDDAWGDSDDEAARERGAGDDEGDEPQDDERPARRRRSRRGRGGRGSRDAAAPPVRSARNAGVADSDVDDDDELDDELPGMRSANDDDDDDASDEPARAGSHKTIPSWAEAIDVMVDVNMQSRKNAPQRSGHSGGRGGRSRGGRGRGRGGDRDRGDRDRGERDRGGDGRSSHS